VRAASRCFGFVARPSREFAPAGDLLFERPKRRQKVAPAPSPLCEGCPAMLERRGPPGTRFATLRSDSRAESDVEVRFAHASASCASRLLQRGVREQPIAKPASRLAPAVPYGPFSTAEERKVLRPRAQHASRTDSAQLSDRSVAKGVLRGASRLEYRRAPEAQRRAVRSGGALCLLSGGPESRSPAGANSRHDRSRKGSAA
jgi:hypothetical protein